MANLSELFPTRQSGLAVKQYLYFPTSGIYTAQTDQEVYIDAIGGSGSGACVAARTGGATGAGAGGRARKRVSLKAGDTLAISVGAGGNGITPAVGGLYAGNNGGDTTVTATGINMIAGGGKGGNFGDYNQAVAGGLGGIASGGDQNFNGGRGGDIVAVDKASYRATGGGAVNLGLGANHGGDLLSSVIAAVDYCQASGGAGIGSDGPSFSSTGIISLPGGGVGPLSASQGTQFQMLTGSLMGIYTAVGPVGAAHVNASPPPTVAGPGGGAGGLYIWSVTETADARAGGAFAGGGAGVMSQNLNSDYFVRSGGGGMYGGGGGGCCSKNFRPGGTASLSGTSGLVVIEVLS